MKLLLCALESSADALGAALMQSIRRQKPETEFIGCGGALMAAQGLDSLFEIEQFSVIGPGGALRVLPAALHAADQLVRAGEVQEPDAAIFIDSWSFSKIAAKKFRRHAPGIKLFKYVAPQVWASRPKRAKIAAELFDGVLCLFKFETELFEREGARTVFVGHSGLQEAKNYKADNAVFRKKYHLGDAPLLAVLPGSRPAELRRHAFPFGETVRLVSERIDGLRVLVPAAPSALDKLPSVIEGWAGQPVLIESAERFDAFAAADAALAASGTVVAELAIFNTPMVVAYRIDLLTELWARAVLTTKRVSLINIAADREVLPEFLQDDCRPELMAAALAPLLTGGPERTAQKAAMPGIAAGWTPDAAAPAADLAAKAVIDWIA
ncbi:lipid-A-disaccharide synthase [Hyphococcus sp.]|uniref:lipid-A-disaccharide synthase n=1 Tax=Hyphococcus sp. TaxID=2038636 RepID=UPI002084210A|nr:MAG: lipid-A-disaccharide synthase [Marinicaulis sp.]